MPEHFTNVNIKDKKIRLGNGSRLKRLGDTKMERDVWVLDWILDLKNKGQQQIIGTTGKTFLWTVSNR